MSAMYSSAQAYKESQQARQRVLIALMLAVVVLVFGTMGVLMLVSPTLSGSAAWVAGAAVAVSLAVPVLIWNEPRRGIYVLIGAAVLFGGDPAYPRLTIPTSLVPFWWDISTIAQRYGTHALDPLVVNPGELVILLTGMCWITRAILRKELRLRGGPLVGWALAYLAVVLAAFLLGMARGGVLVPALWQIRAQFLFVAAFILGANLITKPEHVRPIAWTIVICCGIQGVLGAFTFAAAGGRVNADGIMTHDDSMLFNLLFFILLISLVGRVDKKLSRWALVLTPCAVIAVIANQRRAGFAAFAVAFVPLLPLLWTLMKERRSQALALAGAAFACAVVYFPLAWNSAAPWALGARSVRSVIDPNTRDAGSNRYRLDEDFDLAWTRDQNAWTGTGFGRPFQQPKPLPEIPFPLREYFPHNSLLWIWMNLGHFGFWVFLMMLAAILVRGIQNLKETTEPCLQLVGLLAVLDVLMLIVYGKYDLQLTNIREMVLAGLMVGVLSVLPAIEGNRVRGER